MTDPVDFVLLIDDDGATNFFNSMMLRRHNAYNSVNAVQSGVDALDYLTSIPTTGVQKPSLIFLDINMPGMNGWEFLEAFEQLDPIISNGIKVIILSTSSDPDEVKKSMTHYQVDDFISKPLSKKLLDNVFEIHFKHKDFKMN